MITARSIMKSIVHLVFLAIALVAIHGSDAALRQANPQSNRNIPKTFNLSNRCTLEDQEEMSRCERDALEDWDVRDVDYNTDNRRFCCFIWTTLACEVRVAERCDANYAQQLQYITEQSYGSICDWHSRRSASCALRWWSLMLIIIGILLVIGIVAFLVFRKRQSKYTSEYSGMKTTDY